VDIAKTKSGSFVRLKLISVLVPYIAVLVGLYVLKNGWVAIGLYHLGITVFLVASGSGGLLKKVCTGWNSITAAAGIVIPVMIIPAIFIFWKYMQLENMPLNTALANFGLSGTSWLFFMIYFSTVQPFLEELYWRGYLESGRKYFSWTDLAFAGYHILVLAWFIKLPWLVIAFIVLAGAAYVWRYMAARLEGLIVPLLSHIIADVSIIAVTCVLIR
jgi:membrane protease YdiL (CAAX protease family)